MLAIIRHKYSTAHSNVALRQIVAHDAFKYLKDVEFTKKVDSNRGTESKKQTE
jgi:hypothetical protein